MSWSGSNHLTFLSFRFLNCKMDAYLDFKFEGTNITWCTVRMSHKAQSPCEYSWTQSQLNHTGLRLWNREISLCDLEPALSILDSVAHLETCPASDNLEQHLLCPEGWREKLGGSEISSLALHFIMRPFFKDTDRPIYSCSLTFNCHPRAPRTVTIRIL